MRDFAGLLQAAGRGGRSVFQYGGNGGSCGDSCGFSGVFWSWVMRS